MRIIKKLSDFSAAGPKLSLALGNFDGVHRAHQTLILRTAEHAKKNGGRSAVFTFSVHPQCVLRPDSCPPILTTVDHKLSLFERLGIDDCFLIDFTAGFSEQSAESFVEEILVKQLRVDWVCTGYNARFGKNRSGNTDTLKAMASKFGFYFYAVPPYEYENEIVSSSVIRNYVQAGRLDKASGMLGRRYSVWAEVVRGRGMGRTIGYPTANLETLELLPLPGVYAVEVELIKPGAASQLSGRELVHKGVLNYGTRPTFGVSFRTCEVHLLNFNEDLYGATLEVRFIKKIRDEIKFESSQALTRQIAQDILDSGFIS